LRKNIYHAFYSLQKLIAILLNLINIYNKYITLPQSKNSNLLTTAIVKNYKVTPY